MRIGHPAKAPDYGRIALGLLLIALAYFLMIDPAFAQGAANQSFRCTSGGRAIGTLYDSAISCPTTMQLDNLFTFLICNMERLAGNLLGHVYCGIMTDLIPAVMAMLTLATLAFGISFTIGVIPATARDFQMFLLKVVFVLVFATQADVLIGTLYTLLITGLREGTAVGLSAMFEDDSKFVTGTDVYRYLDGFLAQTMRFATDYVGADAAKGQNPCQNAIFAVLALMVVAFPPVFYIGIMIIFRVSITFLRAVFGYLYSIVGITFLLTLAPVFLSFYLFKLTRPFFDKWMGYLISFSLQMVILFAFLGFILSIDVRHVTSSLTGIIMPVEQTIEATSGRMPWSYCTVCDFQVVDKDGAPYPDDQYGAGDAITEGRLVCKDNPPKPITADTMSAPAKDLQNSLLKFASVALLSLLVLAYLVEWLLNYVAAMAQLLAGGFAQYAPIMGGGQTWNASPTMDVPGGDLANTWERGFQDGYIHNMGATSIGATAEGFKKASERMVMGGDMGQGDDYGAGRNDPGLTQTFLHFILNPHRDSGPGH